jgi:hypothetical protein
MKNKSVLVLISGIVAFVGLFGAAYLVRNQQETRRGAAGEATFFTFGDVYDHFVDGSGVEFSADLYLTPDKNTSAFDVSIPVNCQYVSIVSSQIGSAFENVSISGGTCREKSEGVDYVRLIFRVADGGVVPAGTTLSDSTRVLKIEFLVKENSGVVEGTRIVNNYGWNNSYAVGPDSENAYNLTGLMPALVYTERQSPTATATPAVDTSCAVASAVCSSTTADSITYQITYDDDQKQYWDGLVVGNSPADVKYQENQWPETYTLEGLNSTSSYSYKFGCHKLHDVGTSLSWKLAVNDVVPANGCSEVTVLPTMTPVPTTPAIGGLPSCTITGPNAVYLPGQQTNTYRANFDYDGDLSSLGLNYQWDLFGNGCGSLIDESDLRVVWLAPDTNASCRLVMNATRTVSGQEQEIVCTKDIPVFAAPLTPNPTATPAIGGVGIECEAIQVSGSSSDVSFDTDGTTLVRKGSTVTITARSVYDPAGSLEKVDFGLKPVDARACAQLPIGTAEASTSFSQQDIAISWDTSQYTDSVLQSGREYYLAGTPQTTSLAFCSGDLGATKDNGYCQTGSGLAGSSCPNCNLKIRVVDEILPYATNTPVPGGCSRSGQGDLNCDGRINITDMSILLEAWVYSVRNGDTVPTPKPGRPSADLSNDGAIDVSDAQILIDNWDTIGD